MLNLTIDYKLIGKRIKAKRKELNITQEQLAEKINMTTFYVSKIENGKVSPPLETYAHIAYCLDLDLAYLITGTSTLEKQYYVDELNKICSYATKEQLNLIIKLAKAVLND